MNPIPDLMWQQWVLIGLFIIGGLTTIGIVGKPRQPMTPGAAVVSTILTLVLISVVASIR